MSESGCLASFGDFSPSMLAKHKVVGSIPITRSTFKPLRNRGLFIFQSVRRDLFVRMPPSGAQSFRAKSWIGLSTQ